MRVHHDSAAAQSARALDAQAYSVGTHIAFDQGRYAPHQPEGRRLIAHELAHVAQDRGAAPVLRRKPNAGKTAVPKTPEPAADKKKADDPDWTRLQIHSTGMDAAAAYMGANHLNFRGEELRKMVFVGLHPKFLKVYDDSGKPVGGKLPFKDIKGLKFTPGIYVHYGSAMRAVTVDRSGKRIDIEPSASPVVSRDLSAEEKKQADEEAKKAGTGAVAPKTLPIMDLTAILQDAGAFRQRVNATPNPLVIYFVPTYENSGGGSKQGNGGAGLYASPVEGRGDGQPPNAPPWPVSVTGPKLVPVNANPTYSATIDWGANGNYNMASQAISQIGETIHYRWESFDVTQYAEQQANKDKAKQKGAKVDDAAVRATRKGWHNSSTRRKRRRQGCHRHGRGQPRVQSRFQRLAQGQPSRRPRHPQPAGRHRRRAHVQCRGQPAGAGTGAGVAADHRDRRGVELGGRAVCRPAHAAGDPFHQEGHLLGAHDYYPGDQRGPRRQADHPSTFGRGQDHRSGADGEGGGRGAGRTQRTVGRTGSADQVGRRSRRGRRGQVPARAAGAGAAALRRLGAGCPAQERGRKARRNWTTSRRRRQTSPTTAASATWNW